MLPSISLAFPCSFHFHLSFLVEFHSAPPNTSPVSNDSDGNREVFEMMGVMFITALDMLHESSLIGPVSPLPDNIGLMTLFFLDFMTNTACDFDMNWVHEVVRAADTHGVTLNPLKQIEGVDQGTLDDLRLLCRAKKGKKLDWKAKVS